MDAANRSTTAGRRGGRLPFLVLVTAVLLAGVVAGLPASSVRGGDDLATAAAPRTGQTHVTTSRTNYGGTRTIRAYKHGSRTLFRVSFWAEKGDRRYVSALVRAHHPRSSTDRVLMAAVNLQCFPSAGTASRAGATQNTRRGTVTPLRARIVYAARKTGMVRCFARATGGRPQPHGRGRAGSNVWYARQGSYLAVGAPMNATMRKIDTSHLRSRVLDRPGATWTPVDRTVRLASGTRRFHVVSDHKVTVCSSRGGSKDPTTRGRNLCTSKHIRRGGSSTVSQTVKVRQRRSDGSWCGGWQLLERQKRYRVTAAVHHKMIFSRHRVRVSKQCAPVFTVVVRLRLVRGTDTVVHAGSINTLLTR